MKTCQLFFCAFSIAALTFLFAPVSNPVMGQNKQGKIVATLNFDPEVHGFSFENFGNGNVEGHKWQNDFTYYDMMLMFGVSPVCSKGNSNSTCVARKPAETWRSNVLEMVDGGHCEGMATTSLLFFTENEFKKRAVPANYQTGAETVFDLKFPDPLLENYITYFAASQMIDEVADARVSTAEKGPVGIVKDLIAAMNDQNADTQTLEFFKADGSGGHAVTPIAVEDRGTSYVIHIYDNNNPGETVYMTIEKGGRQTWKYSASTNPNEPVSEYSGDKTTQTLMYTPNSVRYGTRFRAPFSTSREYAAGETTGSLKTSANPRRGESVEFLVNDDADMLVTAGDGKRIGYDWNKNKVVNEITGAKIINLVTGADDDIPPVLHLPYQSSARPYTVTLSGKSLKKESRPDLMYTGPGFSVGFDGIRLDPNETLTFQISPDGKKISFTASADGETPEIYFSFSGAGGESYLVEVDGVELQAGKTLSGEFDSQTGKFRFKDNDGDEDKYDVDFERVTADGTEQSFETDNLDMGKADDYEMDFSRWDGKTPVCFRDDDDGSGFANDECEAQSNEDNDTDADDADDEGDDEDSDIDNDGKFNNADDDDDGDGIADDKDTDDDGDGDDDNGDGDDDNGEGNDDDEPQFLRAFTRLFR